MAHFSRRVSEETPEQTDDQLEEPDKYAAISHAPPPPHPSLSLPLTIKMEQTLASRRLLCAHMYVTVCLLITAFLSLGFDSITPRAVCATVNAMCALLAFSFVLERNDLLLCCSRLTRPHSEPLSTDSSSASNSPLRDSAEHKSVSSQLPPAPPISADVRMQTWYRHQHYTQLDTTLRLLNAEARSLLACRPLPAVDRQRLARIGELISTAIKEQDNLARSL